MAFNQIETLHNQIKAISNIVQEIVKSFIEPKGTDSAN